MKRKSIVEAGSGNVFADLGDEQAPESLLKSRLAQRLANVIDAKGLTQSEVVTVLGIDQPKVSKILRGRLREFSTDRLFRFLNALDQDIQIVITDKPASRRQAQLTVAPAKKHAIRN
jgi:predicted XRE-type DNA-binding protein